MLKDYVKREFSPEQERLGREEEMKRAFLEESGIEGMDANKLRKTILSSDEALAAKTEQMEDIRIRKCRKPDWDEYVDAKRRWGRAMHHSELIRHLRNLIPGLYVCDGLIKGELGLYIWDRNQPFEANGSKKGKIGGTVYLGWIHEGWNPEYEIDLVDDVGVAIKQLRGWRTILMRLICRRDPETFYPRSLFTEQQAQEVFGDPTNGPTASNYRMYLWKFRNTSPEQAKLEHQLIEAAQKYRYT